MVSRRKIVCGKQAEKLCADCKITGPLRIQEKLRFPDWFPCAEEEHPWFIVVLQKPHFGTCWLLLVSEVVSREKCPLGGMHCVHKHLKILRKKAHRKMIL